MHTRVICVYSYFQLISNLPLLIYYVTHNGRMQLFFLWQNFYHCLIMEIQACGICPIFDLLRNVNILILILILILI